MMMNPSSAPYPNSQFHQYPHQIPNSNPQFFNTSLPPPPITQSHDLSTALTTLTHLLTLSQQTLTTLSSYLPIPQNGSSLVTCPQNPNHLMPPESLFLHTLQCPSALFQNPFSFLSSLHYPKTLDQKNINNAVFTQSAHEGSNNELCISLDSFFDEFCSNFFYRDCPGVVKFDGVDMSSKMFRLPGILWIECGHLGDDSVDQKWELWAIQREVDGWVDYPSACSYSVACAMLRLSLVKWSDLRKWLIVNSPRFGVIADTYMRDHLCVLFMLCLKAIRRETIKLIGFETDRGRLSFDCPVLAQVLMWVSSQLSVLYGEVNAKYFAIYILKQCVLEAAKEALLFTLKSNLEDCSKELGEKTSGTNDLTTEEPYEEKMACSGGKEIDGIDRMLINVPQIAAAIAALHERSLIERKLKELRNSRLLPAYQWVAELTQLSMRADEERKRRPSYRAIIEHDGLLRKQSDNQETNKFKTKHELLAEERDYKRRRMSYRGKKLKRSSLEVTRDIIDEYMEEIKQAGGIGCFEKISEGKSSKSLPPSDKEATVNRYKRHYQSNFDVQSKPLNDGAPENFVKQKQSTGGHDKHLDHHRSTSRGGYGGESYYVSPEKYKNRGRSCEKSSHQRQKDDNESSRSRNHNRSCRSIEHDYNYDKKSDVRVGNRRNPHRKHNHLVQNEFGDRYNPTESCDNGE